MINNTLPKILVWIKTISSLLFNILIIHILLFFFMEGTLFAQVNSNRPRVWLNGEIIQKLKNEVNNNTSSWLELKAWCDNYIGKNNSGGYQGQEWHKAVMNYGLCYQVTGNDIYAIEGVKYLKALLRDKNSIGDGLGGETVISIDSGWTSRTFGAGVAVGRDWLSGSSALTSAIISESANRLKQWNSWYDSNGYANNDPHDNYFAGYFSMKYTSAIAMAGDTSESAVWFSQAESMWANKVLPAINGYLDGGDWQEGWNYGQWAAREYLLYPHALATGTSNSTHWDETDWNIDLIKGQIHMLHPSRAYFSDDGSWSGSTKGDPRAATMLMLSSIGSVDPINAGLATWFANNLEWEPSPPNKWEEFLWTDSSITPIIPTKELMGGLSYKINGTNRILSRSEEWSSVNATFVEFAAPSTGSAAQGETNVGEFKIASRGERLIVDSDTYQYTSEYANVLLVNGSHTYAPKQEWWRDNVTINSYEHNDMYVYAKAENLENAYNGKLADNPSAQAYNRELIFLHPDYVFVIDNIIPTNKDVNTIISQVNFNCEPILSGAQASCFQGNAKIFMKILAPGVTISKEDRSSLRAGVWRTDIAPVTNDDTYKMIHLFQTANSSSSSMTAMTNISAVSMVGVNIKESSENMVVLFSADAGSGNVNDVAYLIDATAASGHFLFNMQPNTKYTVQVDGSTSSYPDGIVSSANGVLMFTYSGTGSHTFNISVSGSVGVYAAPPTEVTVSGTTGPYASTISWNLSSDDGANDNDVSGYKIYRSSSSDGTYSEIGNVSAGISTYTDDSPLTGYNFYKISAIDSSGFESSLSYMGGLQAQFGPAITLPGGNFNINKSNYRAYTLVGVTDKSANVEVLADDAVSLGTTTADGNGNWSITVDFSMTPLNEGPVSLTVKSNGVTSNTVTGKFDITVPAPPAIPIK